MFADGSALCSDICVNRRGREVWSSDFEKSRERFLSKCKLRKPQADFETLTDHVDAKPRRGDAFRSGRQSCAEADEADAASSSFEAFGLALSGLLPCSLRIMARMPEGPRFPFSGARAVLS